MRKYLLAISLLALISGSVFADNISVGTVQLAPGTSKEVSVSLNNTKQYAAFQFDVVLPEGITVSKNDKNELMVELTDRKGDHTMVAAQLKTNTYRILVYSMTNAELSGTTGALVNLTLAASDNVTTGEKTANIDSPVFVEANATSADIEGLSFTIKVASAQDPGAEDLTVTTVADKGTSGKFFAKLCPTKDVAVNKDDADVFSIYMDMGIAYFSKLRVRNGMFVVKAGEPVIVKTSEAKTISLSTTEDESSVIFNDVICPSEDITVEDFRKDNSVKDDEIIYMLTNKAENGGFGFTKFTGTTMKAGNYFIVSTVAPPASARLQSIWLDEDGNVIETAINKVNAAKTHEGAIYNLQGVRVNAVQKGIYIKDGKKFVVK